jgi:hypothetical protein
MCLTIVPGVAYVVQLQLSEILPLRDTHYSLLTIHLIDWRHLP